MPPYATWTRRIGALVLDWIAALVLVIAVVGVERYLDDRASGLWLLGIYVVQASLLSVLVGGSLGQLLLGIQVLRTDGRGLDPLRAILRHVLVCLVIPPLVFESGSGRGLHDMVTDAAVYRRVPQAA